MKTLPTAWYLAADQIQRADILAVRPPGANVVKIRRDGQGFSWLRYDDFNEVAFPRLHEAWIYRDGRLHEWRVYRNSRPILHRKELLVAPDDPRVPRWAKLTRRAEALGLFDCPSRIGTERLWNRRLQALGLAVRGHRIVRSRDHT